jgi:uncharacterized protein YuzE
MEEKIIHQIQNSLSGLFPLMEKQKKRHLVIEYDQEADVLYLSFDLPQKADETEFFSDDILIRKKSNKVVGLTLLNFKKKFLF